MNLDQIDQLTATGPLLLAMGLAALAGLVSFASPCVVPLVPGYLSYLAAVVGVEDRPGTAVALKGARLRVAGAAASSRARRRSGAVRVFGGAIEG